MGLSNITVLYAILAVTSLCSGVSSTSLNDNSSTVDQRYTKPLGVNKGFEALTNISSNRIINGDENDADEDDGNDPISLKKPLKLEGLWALMKDILGFTFDGIEKQSG